MTFDQILSIVTSGLNSVINWLLSHWYVLLLLGLIAWFALRYLWGPKGPEAGEF